MGIDVVLGAGGARGLCALGALKVLVSEGVKIDRVIGASMGAIIGAAYCSGLELDEIGELLEKESLHRLVKPSWRGPGLCSNSGVRRMVGHLLAGQSFSSLNIPLAVHCTNLQTGEGISFDSGDLVDVVVGSSVAAGIYDPVEYDGKLLVDGGYSSPVPVHLAKGKIICAVDPTVVPTWDVDVNTKNLLDTRLHKVWRMSLKSVDIMIWHLAKEQLSRSEALVVAPEMIGVLFTEFSKSREVIRSGEVAMRSALPGLKEKLNAMRAD